MVPAPLMNVPPSTAPPSRVVNTLRFPDSDVIEASRGECLLLALASSEIVGDVSRAFIGGDGFLRMEPVRLGVFPLVSISVVSAVGNQPELPFGCFVTTSSASRASDCS